MDEGVRALVYFREMGVPSRGSKVSLDLDEPDDDEQESGPLPRETLKPAFDVERYAEDMTGRERYATITDEAATEEARVASVLMDSIPPRASAAAAAQAGPEVEIDVHYADVDALAHDEQLTFLRARLAPMSRVPVLTRTIAELGPVIEDPKTAYVLGFIDGLLPLETIVEVAGLPDIDTLKILDRAVEQYLVTFRSESELDRA